MRISDWSSDVCSSDLPAPGPDLGADLALASPRAARRCLSCTGQLLVAQEALHLFGDGLGRGDDAGLGVVGLLEGADVGGGLLVGVDQLADLSLVGRQIGRASCRDRVCPYG